MKCDSSSAKQLAVSYLTGNRVLERILQLREQVCFIEEFSGLEMREVAVKIILWQLCHGSQEAVGER